jgi:hypothetical protein
MLRLYYFYSIIYAGGLNMRKSFLFFFIILSFTLNYGFAQDSPILSEPPNLDSFVPTTLTFRWQDLTGVLSYSLEIAVDENFSTMVGAPINTTANFYTMPAGSLSPNTVYYWRVQGIFDIGPGPYSVVFSFRTVGTPSEEIENLRNLLDNVIANNQLGTFQANILYNRINQAQQNLEANNFSQAQDKLSKFQDKVNNLFESNLLNLLDANRLINYAGNIIGLITGNGKPVIGSHFTAHLPGEFSLSQNYPNPFNPETYIDYSVPVKSYVTLKIYNILGEEVTTLISKEQSAGSYIAYWNASNSGSGVYFYKITAGSFTQTKRMILTK